MLKGVCMMEWIWMRFKIMHRFKPLIDAFQGPFKSQYYYWVGIQLLTRNFIALLWILEETICLTLSCIVLVTVALIHGYIQPNKNKIINVQESLLYNFITLCILLVLNRNETLNTTAVNVMVGVSFLHCVFIMCLSSLSLALTQRES